MSKGKGHVPIRTCISCGRKGSKKSMIRLVLNETAAVVMDRSGRAPGRGAYVCNDAHCVEVLRERRRLAKAFRKML
jgi:predicted RNA-binding protein YlxR (DUF448 family)